MRTLLMEPGPTIIDPRVIQAMCRPPLHHLSAEFAEITDETCRLLTSMFCTEGEVALLPATGRGGIEAAFSSVWRHDRVVVVLSNGTFGRMLADVARSVGAEVVLLSEPDGEQFDLDRIAYELRGRPLGVLAMVHCETSTGTLNDLSGYGELARRHGGVFLVDAVSSLGGTLLGVDRLGIDLCVSSGQKSVGAIGGISFVTVSPRAIDAMADRPNLPRSAYFDLLRWWQQWLPRERGGLLQSGFRRFPWSMPTHPVFALHEACRIAVEDETMSSRIDRHERAGRATRAALQALGFPLLPPEGHESPTVTAFHGSAGLPASELVEALRKIHGIQVAGGMDGLRSKIVRIGHMSGSAEAGPLLQTLAAIASEVSQRKDRHDSSGWHDAFMRGWLPGAQATPTRLLV